MAGFGEPKWKRQAREERQRDEYPELGNAPIDIVLAVDQRRRARGEQPTTLGQQAEREYAAGWADQTDPYRAKLRARGVKVGKGASEAQYGGTEPAYEAPDVLATRLEGANPGGFALNAAMSLLGAGTPFVGAGLAALQGDNPAGGFFRGPGGPSDVRGAEGEQLPLYSGENVAGINRLPDRGIGRVTPRNVASLAIEGALDPSNYLVNLPALRRGKQLTEPAVQASIARGAALGRGASEYLTDVGRAANAPLPLRAGEAQMNAGVPRRVKTGLPTQREMDALTKQVAKEKAAGGITPATQARMDEMGARIFAQGEEGARAEIGARRSQQAFLADMGEGAGTPTGTGVVRTSEQQAASLARNRARSRAERGLEPIPGWSANEQDAYDRIIASKAPRDVPTATVRAPTNVERVAEARRTRVAAEKVPTRFSYETTRGVVNEFIPDDVAAAVRAATDDVARAERAVARAEPSNITSAMDVLSRTQARLAALQELEAKPYRPESRTARPKPVRSFDALLGSRVTTNIAPEFGETPGPAAVRGGEVQFEQARPREVPGADVQAQIKARIEAARKSEGETLAGSIPGGPQLSRKIDELVRGGKVTLRENDQMPLFDTTEHIVAPKQPVASRVAGKVGGAIAETGRTAINLKTIWDISAPGRQGIFWTVAHPVKAGPAFVRQVKSLASEGAYQSRLAELKAKPYAALREAAGVALSELDAPLALREEQAASGILGRIPIGRGSNRAYVTYLNEARDSMFDQMLREYGSNKVPLDELQRWGKMINVSTGRGYLPKALEDNRLLGQPILWAPKLLASRVEMPFELLSSSPIVRKEAARQIVAFVAVNTAFLTLMAKSGVADVELDPRSSDFGQARIGDKRYDLWGGYRPIANLVARIATADLGPIPSINAGGNIRTATTGRLYDKNAVEVVRDFFRSKFQPVMGAGANVVFGEQGTGERPSARDLAVDLFAPIIATDLVEGIKRGFGDDRNLKAMEALDAALSVVPSVLGAGYSEFGGEPVNQAIKGVYDADESAWKAVSSQFKREERSYDEWRESAIKRATAQVEADEKFAKKLEGAGKNERVKLIRSEALKRVNGSKAAKLYEEYQTNYRVTWAAQHIDDGLADEALGAGRLTATELREAKALYKKRKPRATATPAGVRG